MLNRYSVSSFPFAFSVSALPAPDTCALYDAGCSRAREYYDRAVSEYEKKHDEEMKEVAAWYRKECEKQWPQKQIGGEERRKQEQENLQQMSDSDLIMLLESLIGAI